MYIFEWRYSLDSRVHSSPARRWQHRAECFKVKRQKKTNGILKMSEYGTVQKSALKLKGVGDISAGKK